MKAFLALSLLAVSIPSFAQDPQPLTDAQKARAMAFLSEMGSSVTVIRDAVDKAGSENCVQTRRGSSFSVEGENCPVRISFSSTIDTQSDPWTLTGTAAVEITKDDLVKLAGLSETSTDFIVDISGVFGAGASKETESEPKEFTTRVEIAGDLVSVREGTVRYSMDLAAEGIIQGSDSKMKSIKAMGTLSFSDLEIEFEATSLDGKSLSEVKINGELMDVSKLNAAAKTGSLL